MSDDQATLRDSTVVDPPGPPPTDPPVTAAASPDPDPADLEALEIGRVLLNSGITREKVNDVLTAPGALESIRYSLQNNPREFLSMLERSDPQTAAKFLNAMADTYVERFQGAAPTKDGKPDPNADLMLELKALREKVEASETRESQRQQNLTLAATRQRLDARVDDLLSLKEVKELDLTKAQLKGLRAQLDKNLASDPNMVQRVSNGNFVDVPLVFKSLIEEYATDKKSAVEAAKTARERAERGAFPEFQNGAEMFAQNIPTATFDSWDATEDGFAKALMGTR